MNYMFKLHQSLYSRITLVTVLVIFMNIFLNLAFIPVTNAATRQPIISSVASSKPEVHSDISQVPVNPCDLNLAKWKVTINWSYTRSAQGNFYSSYYANVDLAERVNSTYIFYSGTQNGGELIPLSYTGDSNINYISDRHYNSNSNHVIVTEVGDGSSIIGSPTYLVLRHSDDGTCKFDLVQSLTTNITVTYQYIDTNFPSDVQKYRTIFGMLRLSGVLGTSNNLPFNGITQVPLFTPSYGTTSYPDSDYLDCNLCQEYFFLHNNQGIPDLVDISWSFTPVFPKLSFVTQPAGAEVKEPFKTQPIVQVLDDQGKVDNTFNGPISLAIKSGTGKNGALLTDKTKVYAVNGVASFADLNIDKAGKDYVLIASIPGQPGVQEISSNPFNVLGNNLVFSTQPAGAFVGKAFKTQPIVQVLDYQDKVDTAFNGSILLGQLVGTGTDNAFNPTLAPVVNGVAKFNSVEIDKTGKGYVLVASINNDSPPVILVLSDPFDVTDKCMGTFGFKDKFFNIPIVTNEVKEYLTTTTASLEAEAYVKYCELANYSVTFSPGDDPTLNVKLPTGESVITISDKIKYETKFPLTKNTEIKIGGQVIPPTLNGTFKVKLLSDEPNGQVTSDISLLGKISVKLNLENVLKATFMEALAKAIQQIKITLEEYGPIVANELEGAAGSLLLIYTGPGSPYYKDPGDGTTLVLSSDTQGKSNTSSVPTNLSATSESISSQVLDDLKIFYGKEFIDLASINNLIVDSEIKGTGQIISYQGSNFTPNGYIDLNFSPVNDPSAVAEKVVRADGSGIIKGTVLVPTTATVGRWLLSATDLTGMYNSLQNFVSGQSSTYKIYIAASSLTVQLDSTSPVTTNTSNIFPNSNGWNKTEVSVTLAATDNISGVKSVTYAINGGKQTEVMGSKAVVPIKTEGTTNLTFFATDNAGNVEATQTKVIKIDLTAPEFDLTFDRVTKSIKLTAIDSTSGPEGDPIYLPIATGERTFTLKDKAGNSLTVTLLLNNAGKGHAEVVFTKLAYQSANSSTIIRSPVNLYVVTWLGLPKDKEIHQAFGVLNSFGLDLDYNSSKNQTQISQVGQKPQIQSGYYVLHALSKNGRLNFSYNK